MYVYVYSDAKWAPVWSCQPLVSMPRVHPRSVRAQTGVSYKKPLVRVVFTFARTFLVALMAPSTGQTACSIRPACRERHREGRLGIELVKLEFLFPILTWQVRQESQPQLSTRSFVVRLDPIELAGRYGLT